MKMDDSKTYLTYLTGQREHLNEALLSDPVLENSGAELQLNQGNTALRCPAQTWPVCCQQESQPSCVRVELWFSLTFTCLELTWTLDPWYSVFYFSRLPSTLCRTSLPVLSSNWHHVLRVLSVIWHPSWRPAPPTPRCRRALWQMWFMLSPLLVWGESFLQAALVSRSAPAGGRAASLTLTQHLRISDEAAVRATPMLRPHLQPGIGF